MDHHLQALQADRSYAPLATFAAFETEFLQVYTDQDQTAVAERTIATIKQTKGAKAYAVLFQQAATQLPGWETAVLAHYFYTRLKNQVKDKLA